MDQLATEPQLAAYHYLPAARAEFLRRLDRAAEAVLAYEEARRLTENAVERAFLTTRLGERGTGGSGETRGGAGEGARAAVVARAAEQPARRSPPWTGGHRSTAAIARIMDRARRRRPHDVVQRRRRAVEPTSTVAWLAAAAIAAARGAGMWVLLRLRRSPVGLPNVTDMPAPPTHIAA